MHTCSDCILPPLFLVASYRYHYLVEQFKGKMTHWYRLPNTVTTLIEYTCSDCILLPL